MGRFRELLKVHGIPVVLLLLSVLFLSGSAEFDAGIYIAITSVWGGLILFYTMMRIENRINKYILITCSMVLLSFTFFVVFTDSITSALYFVAMYM